METGLRFSWTNHRTLIYDWKICLTLSNSITSMCPTEHYFTRKLRKVYSSNLTLRQKTCGSFSRSYRRIKSVRMRFRSDRFLELAKAYIKCLIQVLQLIEYKVFFFNASGTSLNRQSKQWSQFCSFTQMFLTEAIC